MAESSKSLMRRYVSASEEMKGIRSRDDFTKDRISRLRLDIDAFRRDLLQLDNGVTFVLAPDSAEIDSYIDPKWSLGIYCFPIEDRATYDLVFARQQGREKVFKKFNQTMKMGRRVLRARRHLFEPNLLLPPYLEELQISMSIMLGAQVEKDLSPVFAEIEKNIRKLGMESESLWDDPSSYEDLDKAQKKLFLNKLFQTVLESPITFADEMGKDKISNRISKIVRMQDFLNNAKSFGIQDYEWSGLKDNGQNNIIKDLKNITPDQVSLRYLENLFNKLPKGESSSLSIYTDARALAYIAAINGRLREAGQEKIKVQLVTWALGPATVARTFWPERGEGNYGSLVDVRHPKLLAAAIDFSNTDRAELEVDLERLSAAVHLYQRRDQEDEPAQREKKLDDVRSAWTKLDNTLLAWSTKIGETNDQLNGGTKSEKRYKTIRHLLAKNRSAFEYYLRETIDDVSKKLSDSYWTDFKPDNVVKINADQLLNESSQHIVLRPNSDHARFAIALYNTEIVKLLHSNFEAGKTFGESLLQLSEFHPGSGAQTFRAERQLLRAFLYAILDNHITAAGYCRLARAEIGSTKEFPEIIAEISYLAHHAYRQVGVTSRSVNTLNKSLKLLEESNEFWKKSVEGKKRGQHPRHSIAWIMTCLAIAAENIEDFELNNKAEILRTAFNNCLARVKSGSWSDAPERAKIENYYTARAAQAVFIVFVFENLGLGSWPITFGTATSPQIDDAECAWNVVKEILEIYEKEEFFQDVRRVRFVRSLGTYWFSKCKRDRDIAWEELLNLDRNVESNSMIGFMVRQVLRRPGPV